MKKKNTTIVIAAVAAIAIGATATIAAYAKSDDQSVTKAATTAEVETENEATDLNGKIIVMRSFFGGYIIDEDDVPEIKSAAAKASANGDANAKQLSDIVKVIENGQSYDDETLGAEFRIVRKKGNENVTFELPRQKPCFYDMTDWNWEAEVNYYKLDSYLTNYQEMESAYGAFDIVS